MVVTKNYKIEYWNGASLVDVTSNAVNMDKLNLPSTGKIAEGKITLNAEFGAFITQTKGGTAPIVVQYDLMRLTAIGNDETEDSRTMEVTTDLAQLVGKSSYLLPLELEGRERNLAGVPFGGFFRNKTHKEIIEKIVFSYNDQRKPEQPELGLVDGAPDIPDFNPNNWDFTQVDNCYDAMLLIVENLSLPVSSGGAGNRYALVFEDVETGGNYDPTKLGFKILVQGTNNSAPFPVIEQNDQYPIISLNKIKQPPTASLVVARGRALTSTQPQNFTKFTSLIEFYRNIKSWDSTLAYPTDAYVSWDENVGGWAQKWIANSDTTAGDEPGVSGNWTAIDVGDYIGILQYSPFTDDKATVIQNGFANPTGGFDTSEIGAIAVPDHNLVINDRLGSGEDIVGTYRNWVYFRTNSVFQDDLTDSQKNYMYNTGTGFGFYEGFRILVDSDVGTLEPPFDGVDFNGLSYDKNFVKFVATPNFGVVNADGGTIVPGGQWVVDHVTNQFDQCAIIEEAIVYEYNVPFAATDNRIYAGGDRRRGGTGSSFAWRSIAEQFLGNDCFHTPLSIENVDGLMPDNLPNGEPLNDSNGDPYNQNSGVKISYGFTQGGDKPTERNVWVDIYSVINAPQAVTNLLASLSVAVFTAFTTPNYTNQGWWFAWPTPYPFSTFNGITEDIGQLYGGDATSLNDHRYFDTYNIEFTTTGKRGWTHTDSVDLSEIAGVKFLFNFDILRGGSRIALTGDIPFSYWCMDSNGVLWKSQRQIYRHLGETQEMKFLWGDLTPVFRGRTPLGTDNLLENIIVGEVEINEEFFKDQIVWQGFQCELPYDEFGRYSPNLWEQVIKPELFDAFDSGTSQIRYEGTMDAFSFIKTPVAISQGGGIADDRTIIPNFMDYHNIINVEQLQRFADSAQQIEQFPYEQYTIKQGNIADLPLENTITIHDPYLLNTSDEGPNTRNVAVRETIYEGSNAGAVTRSIVGVKVINV